MRAQVDLANLEGSDQLAAALDALVRANDPPRLFQRAARLVRLYDDGPDAPPRAEPHGESSLRGSLAQVADFGRTTANGWSPLLPPRDVARILLARGSYPGVPELERVVDAPVYLEDGTRLEEDGYSAAGRVYLRRAVGLRGRLELMETWEALEVLDEVLADFPLQDAADRAHALALMLTPLVRDLVRGGTPLFLVASAKAGMGKTLLTQACLYPTCGHVPLTVVPRSEEELAKAMVGLLRTGPPAVVLDNLGHELDAPSLAQAITARLWQSRVLGRSEVARFRVRNAWAMTANNPVLSNELRRRTVPIFLRALEAPAARAFHHADLLGWLERHRLHVFTALVSLVEATDLDSTGYSGPVLPSFESWTYVVGGILRGAGVPGFLGNLDRLEEADAESEDLDALLRAVHSAAPGRWMTAGELSALGLLHPSVGVALPRHRDAKELGRALGRMKNNPSSGLILRWNHGKWLVERSSDAEEARG